MQTNSIHMKRLGLMGMFKAHKFMSNIEGKEICKTWKDNKEIESELDKDCEQ